MSFGTRIYSLTFFKKPVGNTQLENVDPYKYLDCQIRKRLVKHYVNQAKKA